MNFQEFKCQNTFHDTKDWNAKTECQIDSKSWKSCRYCRFNKCINNGMQPGNMIFDIISIKSN